MQPVVYLDGRFLEADEAPRISLFDRGYLLGDSVFETLRTYGGVAFAFDAHAERLEHASRVTGIAIPVDRSSLRAIVEEAIVRSGLGSAYVRITVSRGEGGAGLATAGCEHPVLSVVAREHKGYPPAAYERGIDSAIVRARKIPPACLDPAIKSGTYLPNVIARRELELAKMIEGVQLSIDGLVVSGIVSNVFAIRDGILMTPDESTGCRPGVTREVLLDVAERAALRAEVGPLTTEALLAADEVFFANTLMECLPVARLGSRELASAREGSATRRVHAAYAERVRAYVAEAASQRGGGAPSRSP